MIGRFAVVVALLLPCMVMAQTAKTLTFDTPAGKVTNSATSFGKTPQKIASITAKETAAIESLAEHGKAFVKAYLPQVISPTLSDYDRAFAMWRSEASPRFTSQQVISTLGVVLGEKMREDMPLEWVVVKDELGTDYALRAVNFELLTFPFSSVSKRVDEYHGDFIAEVYFAVRDRLLTGGIKKR